MVRFSLITTTSILKDPTSTKFTITQNYWKPVLLPTIVTRNVYFGITMSIQHPPSTLSISSGECKYKLFVNKTNLPLFKCHWPQADAVMRLSFPSTSSANAIFEMEFCGILKMSQSEYAMEIIDQ